MALKQRNDLEKGECYFVFKLYLQKFDLQRKCIKVTGEFLVLFILITLLSLL